MLFLNLQPDHPDTVVQAAQHIWSRALERNLIADGRAWSLCELGCDQTDFEWMCAWARGFNQNQAGRWMDQHHLFRVEVAGRSATSFQTIGLLLLLFCAECARRDGKESEMWPSIRFDRSGAFRFPLAGDKLWDLVGARRGRFSRALKEAAYFWGLRHCFRGEDEQEYFGTIRLQFGFTLDGARRLPEWLCGYGWPLPVRDLVRDRRVASPSFQRLWSSLHALRDGTLTRAQWMASHADSVWLLPSWADEVASHALARRELRAVENTRVGAENEAVSEALSILWDAQNPLLEVDFLGEARLDFDGEAPFFCVSARDFLAPANALWLRPDVGALALYVGSRLVGQWHRVKSGGRLFAPIQKEWTLPSVEPSLTARLVANEKTVVAKQEVRLWDASDGLALWRRSSGKRLDVWHHAPNRGGDYVLLVDGDLQIEPMPARWKALGVRKLLFPEETWWESARILDDGAPFWTPATHDEPDWTREVVAEVELNGGSPFLRLGEEFRVRVGAPAGITTTALRWGGRTLEPEGKGVFRVPPVSLSNLTMRLAVEAEICDGRGEEVTIARQVKLPLRAATWRTAKTDSWRIADGREIWNCAHPREWRFWGEWSQNACLCEAGVPLGPVPLRSASVRPRQKWGAPLSIRDAPFGHENQVLRVCASARDGGAIRGWKRAALSQLDLFLSHPIAPTEEHRIVIWGERGALSFSGGGCVLASQNRWMVPFNFQHADARVLAVGLAYEGVWLGAWFEPDWWKLCPKNWTSERAHRLALLVRWMRLPWREHSQVLLDLAKNWPTETLLAWLETGENAWKLRAGVPADNLVRDVFRGHFSGDAAVAKELVTQWDGSLVDVLLVLSNADPLLAVSFARKLSRNYQRPAFAALLGNAVKRINNTALPNREAVAPPEKIQLQRLLQARIKNGALDEEQSRTLRIALENEGKRRFAGAVSLELLAANLDNKS